MPETTMRDHTIVRIVQNMPMPSKGGTSPRFVGYMMYVSAMERVGVAIGKEARVRDGKEREKGKRRRWGLSETYGEKRVGAREREREEEEARGTVREGRRRLLSQSLRFL